MKRVLVAVALALALAACGSSSTASAPSTTVDVHTECVGKVIQVVGKYTDALMANDESTLRQLIFTMGLDTPLGRFVTSEGPDWVRDARSQGAQTATNNSVDRINKWCDKNAAAV